MLSYPSPYPPNGGHTGGSGRQLKENRHAEGWVGVAEGRVCGGGWVGGWVGGRIAMIFNENIGFPMVLQ